MECEHEFVYTNHSRICLACGTELRQLNLDLYNRNSAPLHKHYNRITRFEQKTNKLLGINGPKYTHPIWAYLESHKVDIKEPNDIRRLLRKWKSCTCKCYDSIFLFSKAFIVSTPAIKNLHKIKCYINSEFRIIHRHWLRSDEPKFYNYDFLLRYICNVGDITQLEPYLKRITCKKRYLFNLQRVHNLISSQIHYTKNCHGLPVSRSRSDLDGSLTLQCQ